MKQDGFNIYKRTRQQLVNVIAVLVNKGIDYKDRQAAVSILKNTKQKHRSILSRSKGKSIGKLLIDDLGEEKLEAMQEIY